MHDCRYQNASFADCREDWVGCVDGEAAAAYIAKWVSGARRVHGVVVDYVGFHNESPWRPQWVERLRKELDSRGCTGTKIVVGDYGPGAGFQSPGIAAKLAGTPALSKVADVVGLHYPVSIMPATSPHGDPGFYRSLWDLPGKQKLWASEVRVTHPSSTHDSPIQRILYAKKYEVPSIIVTVAAKCSSVPVQLPLV